MPNITVRPANGCLFMAGLPLSLSGDEVMPLDYHAGRSGWLLYGRGTDKQRLAVSNQTGRSDGHRCGPVRGRLSGYSPGGFLTQRATRLAHDAGLDVAPSAKFRT